MIFVIIGLIILLILQANKQLDTKRFVSDVSPYFKFLMEDDYIFLLNIRYTTGDLDIEKLYSARIRNGLTAIIALIFIFFNKLSFIYIMLAIIAGFIVFKSSYFKLKSYYKANLHRINTMLPYYLKSLEILVQHYTVPVALARSIETAPDVFKKGLSKLIAKVEAGDQSVDPYMDFAKEYPVRDSMRMMRLLYRLSLGSQENKQEQLALFSKNVSTLQNKAREQKYQERLDKMENKTMTMLMTTGGGILALLMFAMMQLMNI